MKKHESPIQFSTKEIINNRIIEYHDLIEVAQGGPEVGKISIDGNVIRKYRFGGPFLSSGKYIFVPAFVTGLISSGFRLAKIHINKLDVHLLGEKEDLIYLDKIEGGKVHYYSDIEKKQYQELKLDD